MHRSRNQIGLGGTWGIGIVLVALLNLVRLCGSSQDTIPHSYSGKAEPAYYRPSPTNPPALTPDIFNDFLDGGLPAEDARKFDKATQDKLVGLVNQIESTAEKKATQVERFMIQRARYLRSSLESGRCRSSEVELEQLVADLANISDPLKAAILPHAKKIDETLRTACGRQSAAKPSIDGGMKKP